MRLIVWILIAALVVAHQDYWNWKPQERSIGELPVGFVYHIGLSLVASVVWWIATMEAWPDDDISESSDSVGSNESEVNATNDANGQVGGAA